MAVRRASVLLAVAVAAAVALLPSGGECALPQRPHRPLPASPELLRKYARELETLAEARQVTLRELLLTELVRFRGQPIVGPRELTDVNQRLDELAAQVQHLQKHIELQRMIHSEPQDSTGQSPLHGQIQSLQEEKRELQNYLTVLERYLDARTYQTFNTSGCSRCALVGSAGSLLRGRQSHGPAIDGHDCIFRANDPPTPAALAAYVGSRTDFNFVSMPIPSTLAAGGPRRHSAVRNVISIATPHRAKLPKLLAGHMDLKKHFPHLVQMHDDVRETIIRWLSIVNSTHGGPNVGEKMLVFASAFCDEISVYGFDPGSWPYHYYSQGDKLLWIGDADPEARGKWRKAKNLANACHTRTVSHDWEAEERLLALLNETSMNKGKGANGGSGPMFRWIRPEPISINEAEGGEYVLAEADWNLNAEGMVERLLASQSCMPANVPDFVREVLSRGVGH